MTGMNSIETTAQAVSALLRQGLDEIFGSAIEDKVIGPFSWGDFGGTACFILSFLVVHALAAALIHRKKSDLKQHAAVTVKGTETRALHLAVFEALGRPLYLLIWVFGGYFVLGPLLMKLPPGMETNNAREIFGKGFDLGVFYVIVWLFIRLTRVVDLRLEQWASHSKTALDEFLVPLLGKALRAVVPVGAFILALPLIGLPPAYNDFAAKASSLLIIGAVAWFLFSSVRSGRDMMLKRYDMSVADNLRARTIHTQVRVITKTIDVALGILTLGSALMVFNEVRHFGASILASAGLLSIIAGLAAQSTLTNLFAGFQLALAQPIRLDDVVIVEGAWGRVEEITLTYVVVHVWDDTRMIAPLSYFITKPFQNWTRVSANIMGQVHFWADYTLPVSELRPVVGRIVQNCPLWDRRYWNLQVVEASDKAVQLRILATASDSSKAWDLRCQIREEVITYLQEHYPSSLPRTRASLEDSDPLLRAVGGQRAGGWKTSG
jgi:small-conductance mechanosensitive channel